MDHQSADRANVLTLPPLILAATLALGFLLDFIWPLSLPFRGFLAPLGAILVVAAVTLVSLAIRALVAAGTPLDVRKPTSHIVTSSVYALSRNPIYLAMVLLSLGIAFLTGSFWLFVLAGVFAAVLERGVIVPEESYLEHKFGDEYLRYKARVRRWL